jgi:sulfur-oxidizing protein SoxY
MINRRQCVTGALIFGLWPIYLPLTTVQGRAGEMSNWPEVMYEVLGNERPFEGRVSIEAPMIARKGNPIQLAVSVESPMTADDHVKAVHVFAIGNQDPRVASFHFTTRSGVAMVSTRVRLEVSQELIGLAEMNNGAFYIGRRAVKITNNMYVP